jgi:hypothetical protein
MSTLEAKLGVIAPRIAKTVDMLQAQIILNTIMINSHTRSMQKVPGIELQDKVINYLDAKFRLPEQPQIMWTEGVTLAPGQLAQPTSLAD